MDRLTAVLEGVCQPLLIADGQARVEAQNHAAVQLLGPGLVGRSLITVLRKPDLVEAVEDVLAGQPSRSLRVNLPLSGQEAPFCVTVSPLPGGVILAFEDLTAREQVEAMRRDFVANVSHELRTPLTALAGFIETLKGAARNDPAARERFLTIMEGEAARMNRLVDDLLSLSRVEAEERQRPVERVDLAAVLHGVVAAQRQQAESQGVKLSLTGAEAPMMLRADSDQLMQVFLNLVENAVKYGGSGGKVAITVTHVPHDPTLRAPAIAIEVRDWGEGIDALHLPRLTERFYRVDTHRSREKGGTGLGLAIVKHIISRHRGRLRVDSTPGQGSAFTVLLPEA